MTLMGGKLRRLFHNFPFFFLFISTLFWVRKIRIFLNAFYKNASSSLRGWWCCDLFSQHHKPPKELFFSPPLVNWVFFLEAQSKKIYFKALLCFTFFNLLMIFAVEKVMWAVNTSSTCQMIFFLSFHLNSIFLDSFFVLILFFFLCNENEKLS